MFIIDQTDVFRDWFVGLADIRAKAKILARIDNMSHGNLGNVRPVGHGISESKIDYGPGYRIYFMRSDTTLYLLLTGGDKSSQDTDIKKAKHLAARIKTDQKPDVSTGEKRPVGRKVKPGSEGM